MFAWVLKHRLYLVGSGQIKRHTVQINLWWLEFIIPAAFGDLLWKNHSSSIGSEFLMNVPVVETLIDFVYPPLCDRCHAPPMCKLYVYDILSLLLVIINKGHMKLLPPIQPMWLLFWWGHAAFTQTHYRGKHLTQAAVRKWLKLMQP